MHVIIVDDHATNRELCGAMLSQVVDELTKFESGEGVVEAMEEMPSLPDVILLDVMMPIKDGFTTAQEIREAFPQHHIPIIFLTALDDLDSFERCMSLGDDFILKPVEKSILVSKVQAHFRIVKMHQEVRLQRDELSKFNEHVRYDYAIAESIFSNLMDEMSAQVKGIYGVDYISTPSTVFNGDLILVANRPHGGVYVMIADATGHGLPAAISAIPATRAFFSMAAKGLALGEIIRELNDVLGRFLPMGMMLAASVFEIRANGFEVSWWGGGLPDGYLLDKDGAILRKLVSTHMPLGVLKPHEFEGELVHLKLEPDQKIVCYTDGVIEAENEEREQFGQERLEASLAVKRATIPTLFDAVRKFANRNVGDDLSILTMQFPISNNNEVEAKPASFYLSKIATESTLHFPASVLKSVSVMGEVRQCLMGLFTGHHLDLVCSVLSELFANAIEHGLLELDSKIKEEPDGFFTFYQLREDKLRVMPEHLWVTLSIQFDPSTRQLLMVMEHNGSGFDYVKYEKSIEKSTTHGRGIVLVSELCESMKYSKAGRCVKVVYNFDSNHAFPGVV
ncbi:ATP-binding SpoIIE family protein phosphatase [Vibrio ostreicida]|uniref:ATP-binding SpoIIE family protein phosphatase n=1 Tax=Vibrio ostreicida TaxID=526588 RepID=UPI000970BC26|nr:SpoIIE family protein phosphatase [Vibrio ostreicida]